MTITRRNSPNQSAGRRNEVPDFIVLHTTGKTTGSAINTVMNPAAGVSYHFIVSQTGEITQAVNIRDTAWASGTTTDGGNRDPRHSTHTVIRERRVNANLYTVNIGFGDMNLNGWGLTEAQIETGAWLIKYIRDEVERIYGHEIPLTREFIIGHNEIVPRHRPNCPGSRFPWYTLMRKLQEDDEVTQERFNEMMDIWLQSRAELPPRKGSTHADFETAKRAGVTDGSRPQSFITRQEAAVMVQRAFNVKRR
jgi:N-acetyl-anhydromuramyl-L-alanine amidase AmpD